MIEFKPLVSVIMPVYNTSRYLYEAINSVLHQTYEFIELILVDDGSTDTSEDICDRAAEEDSRTHVFHLQNLGVSAARNFGIEHAHGQFLMFMDSDDWIEPDTIAACIQSTDGGHIEVIMYGMSMDYYVDGKVTYRENRSKAQLAGVHMSAAGIFHLLYCGNYIISMCNKLVRTSLVIDNHIRFDQSLVVFEDFMFCLDLLRITPSFRVVDSNYYHYRRSGSDTLNKRPISDVFSNQYKRLILGCTDFARVYGLKPEDMPALHEFIILSIWYSATNDIQQYGLTKRGIKAIKAIWCDEVIRTLCRDINSNNVSIGRTVRCFYKALSKHRYALAALIAYSKSKYILHMPIQIRKRLVH